MEVDGNGDEDSYNEDSVKETSVEESSIEHEIENGESEDSSDDDMQVKPNLDSSSKLEVKPKPEPLFSNSLEMPKPRMTGA